MRYYFNIGVVVLLLLLVVSCGAVHQLKTLQPRANVTYTAEELRMRAQVPKQDTITKVPEPIIYTREDGTQLTLVESSYDSLTKEHIASIQIQKVSIVSASLRRVAERNGLININFMVVVPAELQHSVWQARIDPLLEYEDKQLDTLQQILLTGRRFRAMQEHGYSKYDKYLSKILPDSADIFDTYVNHKRFYAYLNRVDKERRKLLDMINQTSLSRYGILRYRFLLFNAKNQRLDSIHQRHLDIHQRLISRRKSDIYRSIHEKVSIDSVETDRVLQVRFPWFNTIGQKRQARQGATSSTASIRYYQRDILPDSVKYHPSAFTLNQARITRDTLSAYGTRSAYKLGLGNPFRHYSYMRNVTDPRIDSISISQTKQRMLGDKLHALSQIDSGSVVDRFIDHKQIALNKRRIAEKDQVFSRLVPYPYATGLRLDSVITSRNTDTLYYHYTQAIKANDNTAKLFVYLQGELTRERGIFYALPPSDTLTYSVSSMTNFVDTMPRYIKRVVRRDAEASTKFLIGFPKNKTKLSAEFANNAAELKRVQEVVRNMMTDPIFVIDSITVSAASSPEGNFSINRRLSEERAASFGDYLKGELNFWIDSLSIQRSITMNADGTTTMSKNTDGVPDLKGKVNITSIPENWTKLQQILYDEAFELPQKSEILEMINTIDNPDTREQKIRRSYPSSYNVLRTDVYPKLREVDIKFSLKRRGMQQDTMITTELDSAYMEGVRLLRARHYEEAITILRPYADVNTALAYMSLGYDDAALRLFKEQKQTDEIIYAIAILYARKGDTANAVKSFLRSVEMNPRLRFRGNLDPEISDLIKKFKLFEDM